MLFLLYSDGGFHPSPHSAPIRKEKNGVLQLLFIDTQVGSIATGLEAAAVVGKMEGGVCLQRQLSVGIYVHNAQGGSGGDGVGWRSK